MNKTAAFAMLAVRTGKDFVLITPHPPWDFPSTYRITHRKTGKLKKKSLLILEMPFRHLPIYRAPDEAAAETALVAPDGQEKPTPEPTASTPAAGGPVSSFPISDCGS